MCEVAARGRVLREGLTVADRYEVVGLLGRGGLAEVWEARDRQLRRRVAVKFVTGVARFPDAARRFAREAEVLAALRHPGVVTVYDAGSMRGEFGGELPYLVMELVVGKPWDEAPVASVTETAAQVADALAHVHAAKIAHRDVKPANIMIAKDGDPILLDFGIARDDNALSLTITVTGNGFGTPRYMAPEQAAGQRGTSASDIYALGLIVLEKLTGSVDPGLLDGASSGLSDEAVALLTRMTARDPAGRPGAAECSAELRALDGGRRPRTPVPPQVAAPEPLGPEPSGPEPSGPEPSGPEPLEGVRWGKPHEIAYGVLYVAVGMGFGLGPVLFPASDGHGAGIRAVFVALCGILSLPGAMIIATRGLLARYFEGLSYFSSLGLLFQRRTLGQHLTMLGIPIVAMVLSVVADVMNP